MSESIEFQAFDFGKLNLPLILLHSDLHLETGPFTLRVPENSHAVVIIAGDSHNGINGLPLLRAMSDKPTVVVAGNHEFWGGDYFDVLADLKAASKENNLYFLENSSVVLSGVRFLGATLWTDYHGGVPALMHYGLWNMRDHRYIKAAKWWTAKNKALFLKTFGQHALATFEGQFNPLLQRELHLQSVKFLARAAEKRFEGPTVVVTHHAPCQQSLLLSGTSEYALNPTGWVQRMNDHLNLTKVGSYASPILEKGVLGKPAKNRRIPSVHDLGAVLWAHGHIHQGLDFGVGGLRVVCNPRGRVRKPLTEADALDFAMLGYPLRVGDIEASIAAHAENPEEGDSFDYDPVKAIDLADHCYHWIKSDHEKLVSDLAEIRAELKAMKATVRSTKKSITDLVAYRVDVLRARAIENTQMFLNKFLKESKRHYGSQESGLRSMLTSAKLSDYQSNAILENIANFESAKWWHLEKGTDGRLEARLHLRQVISEMRHLGEMLAKVPRACDMLRQDYWACAIG